MGMNPEQFISFGSAFPEMKGRSGIFGEKTFLDPNNPKSLFATGDLDANNADTLKWARTQRLAAHLLDRNSVWGSNPYGDNSSSLEEIISFHANEFSQYQEPSLIGRQAQEIIDRVNNYEKRSSIGTQAQEVIDRVNRKSGYESTASSANGILNEARRNGNTNYVLNNPLFLEFLSQNFDQIDDESDNIWNDGELEQEDIVQAMNEFYGVYNLTQNGFNVEVREQLAEQFINSNAYNVDNAFSDSGNVTTDDIDVAKSRAKTGINRLTIDSPKFLSFLQDNFDNYSDYTGDLEENEIMSAIKDWNRTHGRFHGQIMENEDQFQDTFNRIENTTGNWFDGISRGDIDELLKDKQGTQQVNYRRR